MNRPAKQGLTERELEVMHSFWEHGEVTAAEARDHLAERGIDIAYVTVANLVRILVEKKYLKATNSARPFRYVAIRSFDDVSGSLVGDLIKRVFHGSREQLLLQVLSGRRRLSAKERALLEQVLKEKS
jgi:predicted transcriptional regulator